jgi:formylglycine-generating enzyme required for sulfatase activity
LRPTPKQHSEPGPISGFVRIPAGEFDMGDHQGFGNDEGHPSDEIPIHRVQLDSFCIATTPVTNQQYCTYLNAALAEQQIRIKNGQVYSADGKFLYCDTHESDEASSIGLKDGQFVIVDQRANHPVVCIRWHGAAACCNWLSRKKGYEPLYAATTWQCDYTKPGYRLPTEAEWEYAGRGGLVGPYYNFPWGDDPDVTKANWPESRHPYRTGPYPWTTPVGFFNGELHHKADFHWPGKQDTYQTANGANGYGLYDMAGNVWQWVNDWYDNTYYQAGPTDNPHGPDQGRPMRDGKPYRCIRGGSWYNGEWGHSRVSNRNPSYYRGPDDPNHRWYHIGFRVVLKTVGETTSAGASSLAKMSEAASSAATASPRTSNAFGLLSPEVAEGGTLPKDYTGDGSSATLPLEWSGAPAGTRSFALIMHHLAPDGIKWYWVLYNIPATVTRVPNNVHGIGTLGNNSVNEIAGYAPPRSKGPGPKKYTYTVYALSAPPRITVAPSEVSRDVLLSGMKGLILASAELNVVYTRESETDERGPRRRPDQGGPPRGGSREPPLKPKPEPREPREQPATFRPEDIDSANRAGPNGQTVGLFKNSSQACPGYTLFAPKHNNVVYLIDNAGRVVQQWKSAYEPGQSVYLKPNGNLLHCCFTKNRGFTSGGEGGRVEEFDWAGNLVWEFEYSSDEHLSHHDIAPLPNGNILMLAVEKKSYEECLAAGFNPEMLRDRQLFPDSVIEVRPTYPKGGKIIWEWRVWDHLIQDFDRTKSNYGDVAAHPELIDVACNGRGAPAFWNHMNSIAYNAKLDQIVLSVRGCNEIWVIDHSTTTKEAASHTGGKHGKGGDLIYRWGNPAAYWRGTTRDKQLVQQHDAQWIPDGYPGAGHITIFNNGYDRGWSSVEEIVPPMDANGRYILAPGKAYGPEKPVWRYEAKNRTDFFSSEISGAHRLPNGNTLICAGVTGNLFEVTLTGETVWQYVNPMVRGGILAQGEVPGKDHRGHLWNAVFKVHRYAPDYPGLQGRDLTPKGVIELPASQKGKTGLDKMTEQQRDDRGPAGKGKGKGKGKGGRGAGKGGQDGGEKRPPRDD